MNKILTMLMLTSLLLMPGCTRQEVEKTRNRDLFLHDFSIGEIVYHKVDGRKMMVVDLYWRDQMYCRFVKSEKRQDLLGTSSNYETKNFYHYELTRTPPDTDEYR